MVSWRRTTGVQAAMSDDLHGGLDTGRNLTTGRRNLL
jgi:hypothetical protein